MTERDLAASGIDTTVPNVARIYDYLLGGMDNLAADRFKLVDPGVVWMTEWRPDPGIPHTGQARSLRAGIGRKP